MCLRQSRRLDLVTAQSGLAGYAGIEIFSSRLLLPLPQRERTEVRVPIDFPPHPYLLPQGEKEPMLDTLAVSKRKASTSDTAKHTPVNVNLCDSQSWAFTDD